MIAALLAAALLLPVLVTPYLPLGDYPAHLARFYVMLNLEQNPVLQRYYTFKWMWNGNLGTDLLAIPLGNAFGIERAGRIIVFLIAGLSAAGIFAVIHALGRRMSAGPIIALSFVWSATLLYGFLNFNLALALAMLTFAAWIALEQRRWRWAIMIPASCIVWLSHVAGWGTLGLIVAAYEFQKRRSLRDVFAVWSLAFPAVFILLFRSDGPPPDYGLKDGYPIDVILYKMSMWALAMRDQWKPLDILSIFVIGLFVRHGIGRKLVDWRLGAPAIVLAISSIVIPRHLFGGDLADYRMVPPAFMLAAMAIEWPATRRSVRLATAFVALRLLFMAIGWQRVSADLTHDLAVVDQLPRGAYVATAVVDREFYWGYNPYEHTCGYLVVRRDALTNCNFALPGVHMLGLAKLDAKFVDPHHHLKVPWGYKRDLRRYRPARVADYLWLVNPQLVARYPDGAKVIWRGRHSLLLRLAKRENRD